MFDPYYYGVDKKNPAGATIRLSNETCFSNLINIVNTPKIFDKFPPELQEKLIVTISEYTYFSLKQINSIGLSKSVKEEEIFDRLP